MNETEYQWEKYADLLDCIKVNGGHLFRIIYQQQVGLCFVPDVDLQRYQAHLRDAYDQGFKDGKSTID